MAKPLVLDLHIPYCIRPENYLAHFNAVGSNAEKNAYMDALKREVLSYEGELDGYEIRAVHLSGGSASVMAPDLLGDVLRTVRTHLPVAQGEERRLFAPLAAGARGAVYRVDLRAFFGCYLAPERKEPADVSDMTAMELVFMDKCPEPGRIVIRRLTPGFWT